MSIAWRHYWGEPDPDEPNELDDDYEPEDDNSAMTKAAPPDPEGKSGAASRAGAS